MLPMHGQRSCRQIRRISGCSYRIGRNRTPADLVREGQYQRVLVLIEAMAAKCS